MPKKRQLSEFLGRELLYDYATGRLDAPTRVAVDECIRENEEIGYDLRALNEAIKYCDNLRNTKLSEPVISLLNEPAKTFGDHVKSWQRMRPAVRHSIEATVISVLLGVVIVSIPQKFRLWDRDSRYTVIEVARDHNGTEVEVASVTTTTVSDVYGPPTPAEYLRGGVPAAVVVVAPLTTSTVSAPVQKQADVVEIANDKIVKSGKGEIFRVTLKSARVEELTPQFTEKILKLGGQKAGEVQLGWRRQQGSYFHFTLPQSNYDVLKKFLQSFGPVRIVREAHPRVMPEGQIRLILWLEESADKSGTDVRAQKPE